MKQGNQMTQKMKFLVSTLVLFCFAACAIAIETEEYDLPTIGELRERRIQRVTDSISKIQDRLKDATGRAKDRLAGRLASLQSLLERLQSKLEPKLPAEDVTESSLYTVYDSSSALERIDDAIDRLMDRMRDSPLKWILQRKIDRLRIIRRLIEDRLAGRDQEEGGEVIMDQDLDDTSNYNLDERIKRIDDAIDLLVEKMRGTIVKGFLQRQIDVLRALRDRLRSRIGLGGDAKDEELLPGEETAEIFEYSSDTVVQRLEAAIASLTQKMEQSPLNKILDRKLQALKAVRDLIRDKLAPEQLGDLLIGSPEE